LLLAATVLYVSAEQGYGLWRRHQAMRAALDDARNLILRSGERSHAVLLCAQAQWLFRQPVPIRVRAYPKRGECGILVATT
jgi:hypothetical protein